MTLRTVKDLHVYRQDSELLVVSSWITNGRCAEVFIFPFSERPAIHQFLIPKYMGGITVSLIREAVDLFLESDKAKLESSQRV